MPSHFAIARELEARGLYVHEDSENNEHSWIFADAYNNELIGDIWGDLVAEIRWRKQPSLVSSSRRRAPLGETITGPASGCGGGGNDMECRLCRLYGVITKLGPDDFLDEALCRCCAGQLAGDSRADDEMTVDERYIRDSCAEWFREEEE